MMQMQLQLYNNGGRFSFFSPPPSLPLSSSSTSYWRWRCRCSCEVKNRRDSIPKLIMQSLSSPAMALVAVAVVLSTPPPSDETLSNIPPELSGEVCDSSSKECQSGKKRIQRPNSRNAESCTIKCVTTCIRGGDGSPGEGPLNVRGPLVVFKRGFRTRQYCLVECSDICNLLNKAEKGR